jgi:hypothetical protein
MQSLPSSGPASGAADRPRRIRRSRSASAARGLAVMSLAVAALALGGCGVVGVKPWERDLMAKPEMLLDSAPIDSSIDDHIYFSKEATTGGRGFGGGGCGCN